jgi:hypothetical protein
MGIGSSKANFPGSKGPLSGSCFSSSKSSGSAPPQTSRKQRRELLELISKICVERFNLLFAVGDIPKSVLHCVAPGCALLLALRSSHRTGELTLAGCMVPGRLLAGLDHCAQETAASRHAPESIRQS